MIQVSVSEIKNRLSHYLRLVRGGEEVEILDRKTPVARIIHVSRAAPGKAEAPWVKEVEQLGLVVGPQHKGYPRDFLAKKSLPAGGEPGVLRALLEERDGGR
jgi:prevent-host-death family protein